MMVTMRRMACEVKQFDSVSSMIGTSRQMIPPQIALSAQAVDTTINLVKPLISHS